MDATAIIFIPCHIRKIIATTILIASALLSTTSSIFPFSFCGETERLACYSIQLTYKFLTVVPTNFLYRQVVTLKI